MLNPTSNEMVWKLHNGDDEELWKKIILGKYGRDHDSTIMSVKNSDSSF